MMPHANMEHLPWAVERVLLLHDLTERLCRERLDDMVPIDGEVRHGRCA